MKLSEKKHPKKQWVAQEMLNKMDERRRFKHQNAELEKMEYRRLNGEIRKETEKAKEIWLEEQCSELEELQKQWRYCQVGYNNNKENELSVVLR